MTLAGVLNINKPAGITSHDVVDRIRRVAQTRRVGHTGTLDPIATGVLPICVGPATRIAQYLMAMDKEYIVEMTLGLVTDSQDTTGAVIEQNDFSQVTEDAVRVALAEMVGPQQQTPPMVSAKHHQGERLYELARRGLEVERKPCRIEVLEMELLTFEPPKISFRSVCSKGTYVRTLCHDLGQTLRCGGAMSGLVRTRAGSFRVEESVPLNALKTRADVESYLVNMADSLARMPALRVADAATGLILNGRAVPAGQVDRVIGSFAVGEEIRVVDAAGSLVCIAVAVVKSEIVPRLGGNLGVARPVRVLRSEEEPASGRRRGHRRPQRPVAEED